MAAYVIASYDIADAEAYRGYVPGVAPLLAKHGAEILVADYDAKGLEGTSEECTSSFDSNPTTRPWPGTTTQRTSRLTERTS